MHPRSHGRSQGWSRRATALLHVVATSALFASCRATHASEPADAGPDASSEPPASRSSESAGKAPAVRDVRTIVWQPGIKNAYPRWSNDGRSILFQSNRSGRWQIYVMDADGGRVRALTSGDSNNNFPDWSPDNQRIAFVSDRDGDEEVYVMRMDGSELRNLSSDPARDIHPYWSPDGAKLLFNSTRDGAKLQIYEVNADGTGLKRLVKSPDEDTCARISPNDDRIVYLANLSIGQDDVMLCRRDGTEPVNLTNDAAPDGWPAWVADGRHIVYSSAKSGTFCLYLMDLSSKESRRLTFAEPPFEDARASVSRDRMHVVFNRGSGETIGICIVDMPSSSVARP
jgi:Tol biopolymer transport system component